MFKDRPKRPEYPGKKPLGAKTRTNNKLTPIWHRCRDFIPVHIGGRPVLSQTDLTILALPKRDTVETFMSNPFLKGTIFSVNCLPGFCKSRLCHLWIEGYLYANTRFVKEG